MPSLRLSPVRTVLSNGLRVLTRTTHPQPAVAIHLSVPAGSVFDPPAREGLSNFVACVIDRGTDSQPADAIAETFDLRGVSLQARASRHRLSLACDCLTEDFEAVMSLLGDITRHPSFPESEVEQRRGEIATAIRRQADTPADAADDAVRTLIYGATHPYGRLASGTLASIKTIGRADLAAFHRARVTPTGASLAVVGDVEPAAAVATAERVFDGWSSQVAEAAIVPPPDESPGPRRRVVTLPGKVQAAIAYGCAAITRTDPRYASSWVMNTVLGQFGLGGRLGESIRERQGMAYYASSGLEANVGRGALIVSAGVSPANVARTLRSIETEVVSMRDAGVTDAELTDAKRYLTGSIPRMLETNASIAGFLQMVDQFELGLDYEVRLRDLVESVTRDDVHEAARLILVPDRAAVAVAGPIDDAVFSEAAS